MLDPNERFEVLRAWSSVNGCDHDDDGPIETEASTRFEAFLRTGAWFRKTIDPTLESGHEVSVIPPEADVAAFMDQVLADDAQWVRDCAPTVVDQVTTSVAGAEYTLAVTYNDGSPTQRDTYTVSTPQQRS